jgi:asparagine synthase (glutamine-hydrolysing)
MCGIVGWASSNHKAFDIPLEKMRDQLLHRGPDDQGLWFSADRRIGMGHTRLSIIDLSQNAHQPMVLEGGRLAIVFNGEIYNFQEIRSDLEQSGHSFSSRSDTEVVLHAYQQWGTSCVSRFDGMFAFALYDAAKQSVFLARDRVGEKPLYYAQVNGTLLWASEPKALIASGAIHAQIDASALREYLAYGFVGGESCIFRGIHKLPPAHGSEFDLRSGRFQTWRYWSIPDTGPSSIAADKRPAARTTASLVEELKRLLVQSVKLRSIADVPMGILLSSGVDSSLIAAVTAELTEGAVNTFTVVHPDSPEYDEGPGAQAVASLIGSKHTELHIESLHDSLLEMLARQFDEPLADQSIIPTYLVCKALRSQVKVAMTGDGGDELFGGYPHYRLVSKQALLRKMLPRVVRDLASRIGERFLPIGFRGRNHLIGLSGTIDNAIAHTNLYFDPRAQSKLLVDRTLATANWQLSRNQSCPPGGTLMTAELQAMRTDFATVLPDNYLVKTDRASMLASVELRSPMLNPEIIAFAFNSVPQSLRFDHIEQKVILRLLLAKLIPEWRPSRKKQGFIVPLRKWINGKAGKHFYEILMDPGQTLFQRNYVKKLFSLHLTGINNANRIFSLVMFELWRRQYRPALPFT